MADVIPLTITNGEVERIQSGDTIDPSVLPSNVGAWSETGTFSDTSGIVTLNTATGTFNPASGDAKFQVLNLETIINQSGATGGYTGFRVNVTETAYGGSAEEARVAEFSLGGDPLLQIRPNNPFTSKGQVVLSFDTSLTWSENDNGTGDTGPHLLPIDLTTLSLVDDAGDLAFFELDSVSVNGVALFSYSAAGASGDLFVTDKMRSSSTLWDMELFHDTNIANDGPYAMLDVHTGLAGINWRSSNTAEVQSFLFRPTQAEGVGFVVGSGSIPLMRHFDIEVGRLQGDGSGVTVDVATTFYIQRGYEAHPTTPGSLTVTRPLAFFIDAGDARFDGNIDLANSSLIRYNTQTDGSGTTFEAGIYHDSGVFYLTDGTASTGAPNIVDLVVNNLTILGSQTGGGSGTTGTIKIGADKYYSFSASNDAVDPADVFIHRIASGEVAMTDDGLTPVTSNGVDLYIHGLFIPDSGFGSAGITLGSSGAMILSAGSAGGIQMSQSRPFGVAVSGGGGGYTGNDTAASFAWPSPSVHRWDADTFPNQYGFKFHAPGNINVNVTDPTEFGFLYIRTPTIGSHDASAYNITNCTNVIIEGAPDISDPNITATNLRALWVQSGLVEFADDLIIGGDFTVSGAYDNIKVKSDQTISFSTTVDGTGAPDFYFHRTAANTVSVATSTPFTSSTGTTFQAGLFIAEDSSDGFQTSSGGKFNTTSDGTGSTATLIVNSSGGTGLSGANAIGSAAIADSAIHKNRFLASEQEVASEFAIPFLWYGANRSSSASLTFVDTGGGGNIPLFRWARFEPGIFESTVDPITITDLVGVYIDGAPTLTASGSGSLSATNRYALYIANDDVYIDGNLDVGGNFSVGGAQTFSGTFNSTTGEDVLFEADGLFNPTSGDADFVTVNIQAEIDQTAPASGNYTALRINVDETSVLGSDNRILDIQRNGVSFSGVDSSGNFRLTDTSYIAFSTTSDPFATADVFLRRDDTATQSIFVSKDGTTASTSLASMKVQGITTGNSGTPLRTFNGSFRIDVSGNIATIESERLVLESLQTKGEDEFFLLAMGGAGSMAITPTEGPVRDIAAARYRPNGPLEWRVVGGGSYTHYTHFFDHIPTIGANDPGNAVTANDAFTLYINGISASGTNGTVNNSVGLGLGDEAHLKLASTAEIQFATTAAATGAPDTKILRIGTSHVELQDGSSGRGQFSVGTINTDGSLNLAEDSAATPTANESRVYSFDNGGTTEFRIQLPNTLITLSDTPPTVSGSTAGNVALQNLLTTLESIGFIVDGTT